LFEALIEDLSKNKRMQIRLLLPP